MPIHGGDLAAAERRYGRPTGGWLDLSTGINAVAYPLPALPDTVWRRLPQADREATLLAAAREAYGVAADKALVAASGTQALIQLLPRLAPAGPVAVLAPTYAEHAHVWRTAGFAVNEIRDLAALNASKVAVVVNPNNPDGRMVPPDTLLAATADLRREGGMLVVDEAFADVVPGISVGSRSLADGEGIVCLRSFGKFFGLAGVRLGFAVGDRDVIDRLGTMLGPWAVSGPAIETGIAALSDQPWITAAREDLAARSSRLDTILAAAGLSVVGGTTLYRLAETPDARLVQERLAHAGIWTRRFTDDPSWLRFGVPGTEAGFGRLVKALRAPA